MSCRTGRGILAERRIPRRAAQRRGSSPAGSAILRPSAADRQNAGILRRFRGRPPRHASGDRARRRTGTGFRDIAAIAAEQGHTAEALRLLEAAGLADPLDPTTRLVARQLRSASDDVPGAETRHPCIPRPSARRRCARAGCRPPRDDTRPARRPVLGPAGRPADANRSLRGRRSRVPFGDRVGTERPWLPGTTGPLAGLSGNTDGAITASRRFVELTPDNAENAAKLAMLLAQSGDFAGAEQYLRRAISLAPENDRYRRSLAYILETRNRGLHSSVA